jgi:regulator of RNase E activity RraA
MEIELSVTAWAWWWNSVCGDEAQSKEISDSTMGEMLETEIVDGPESDSLQELNWPVPPGALVVNAGDSVVTENNGMAVVVKVADTVDER